MPDSPKQSKKIKPIVPLVNPELSAEKGAPKSKRHKVTKRLVKDVNLKENGPTVEFALQLLRSEISDAKRLNYKVLRLIHGYGSTGLGGAIKSGIIEPLEWMRNEGRIEELIVGEKFNCFNEKAVNLVNRYAELKKDSDYLQENPGVTIVVL